MLCGSKKRKLRIDPPNIHEYVNNLNSFYARFDLYDFNVQCKKTMSIVDGIEPEHITITREDTRCSLKSIKCGKAGGPDNIGSKLLKYCAEQLVNPVWKFFQASLDQSVIPDVWKKSEIIPVPRNNNPKELNDLRPVALTPILMKCLKHVVTPHHCRYID